jgi:hypothetical protein
MSTLPHERHTSGRIPPAELVAQDRALGLITAVCLRCGITCGILPGSSAWHHERRMMVVDPAAAAGLRKRRKARNYMRRRRGPQGSNISPGNPASTRGLEGPGGPGHALPLPAA